MKRRYLLQAAALSGATALAPATWVQAAVRPPASESLDTLAAQGWRVYDIATTVEVGERTAQASVWLPLPADDLAGFQRVLGSHYEAPGAAATNIISTRGQDVRALAVQWRGDAQPQTLHMTNRVAVRGRHTDWASAHPRNPRPWTQAQLRPFLQPTSLAPLDGKVRETAQQIQREAGKPTDTVDQARAIYDWIVANCQRVGSVRGCGTGNVAALLESGDLGGKCADLNGLFVALARASGIPARDLYGVRIDNSDHGYKSLGKAGDISKAQHCRADFYAAGYGWVPADAADVRKVVLEEVPGGLPLTDARVRAARSMLFGYAEGNWMAYNTGHDVALPGFHGGPLGFFMYPNGQTAAGLLDSLDAANFKYSISSKRVV